MRESLFRSGAFRLHAGEEADWKIECDVLTPDDWRTLASVAARLLPPFSTVEGVPTGGLVFAMTLRLHARPGGGLLIADDVLTTGASMEAVRNGREANGVVAFARGRCPLWILPLWRLNLDGLSG